MADGHLFNNILLGGRGGTVTIHTYSPLPSIVSSYSSSSPIFTGFFGFIWSILVVEISRVVFFFSSLVVVLIRWWWWWSMAESGPAQGALGRDRVEEARERAGGGGCQGRHHRRHLDAGAQDVPARLQAQGRPLLQVHRIPRAGR